MYEISANIELMFTENDGEVGASGDGAAERVRAAAALGVPAVEIWLWRSKNLDALDGALTETGVALQTMCVDPMANPLVDRSTHEAFLAALTESAAVADRLGCPYLVVLSGDEMVGVSRADQHQAIVDALVEAGRVLAPFDATLLLENLNSRVDHVGIFLDSTAECLEILDEVASPKVKLLYDMYHSLVMEERPEVVLAGRMDMVGHVQTADIPGRHEPGAGDVDWQRELGVLRELGYTGRIGLECKPTTDTARSLQYVQKLAASLP